MSRSNLLKGAAWGLAAAVFAIAPAVLAQPSRVYERGLAEMSHRDFEGAINSFSEVIGFDMTNADAYFKRGQCRYYQKDYPGALSDFEYLLKMRPTDTQGMLWSGTAQAKLGHEKTAIDLYLRAMHNDPKLVTQFQQGNGQNTKSANPTNVGAVSAYEKAVQLYLGEAGSTTSVSSSADKKSDIPSGGEQAAGPKLTSEERIEKLDAAILTDPGNATLFFRRGRVNKRLGNADKALADFSEAIRLDPTKPSFYLARARLYHEQNKSRLSQADIKKAQSIDPTVPQHVKFTDSGDTE